MKIIIKIKCLNAKVNLTLQRMRQEGLQLQMTKSRRGLRKALEEARRRRPHLRQDQRRKACLQSIDIQLLISELT